MSTLQQRIQHLQQTVAASFDVSVRKIYIQNQEVYLMFLSSLSDTKLLSYLVESIVISTSNHIDVTFYPGAVETIQDEQQAITSLLSGQCLVLLENSECYYVVETRQYPARSTAEPEVERSVRGSHDGFVENILLNVGLIRRRIRDPKLKVVLYKEGLKTKTDVAYAYIEKLVDPDILQDIQQRLQQLPEIEILNERYLVEALYGKTWNPYPHVRYSERPDLCAIHLLQGYVVLLVDNTPNAVIIPTTFFEMTQQLEEYTQTTLVACFTRIVRMIGILFSLYLLPLWIALVIDQNPTMLKIPLEEVNVFTFGVQIMIADIVVEWIRQSLVHTPSLLSSIMSFIAVFVLGDLAIGLGAYTEEILIMVALCNIGNLLTPSYELSLANKIFRIIIGALALCFSTTGFCLGVLIHFIVLVSTKTQKYPYLYPLIPFSYKEMKRLFLGEPVKVKK